MSTSNGKADSNRRQRGPHGHFLPGNNMAKGKANHYGPKIYALKRAIIEASDPKDVVRCMRELKKLWTDKKVPPATRLNAIHEWLDRVLGKAKEHVTIETETADLRGAVLRYLEGGSEEKSA